MREIKILDCTLRDGGYALEHKVKKKCEVRTFTREERIGFVEKLSASNIDIIELGTVQETANDRRGFAIFPSIEGICKEFGCDQLKQECSVFFRGPDIEMGNIPEWRAGLCKIIRLCIRYSELEKSLDYCKKLIQKGYKVSIQPSVTMRYSESELKRVIEAANDMNAYALYFVDSYGYMTPDDVKRLFTIISSDLKETIQIGFHAHNNLSFATANVMEFMSGKTNHDLIIDTCCLGMGQGTGNLQTESFVGYLEGKGESRYDFIALLEACEIIGNFWNENLWGYSVPNAISAAYKVAYGYALELEEEYQACFSDMARILRHTPEEMRHRFTVGDLEEIINIAKNDGEKVKI